MPGSAKTFDHTLGVITRRPGWVLLIVLAVTVLAFSRIVDFRTGEIAISFDPSTNTLLPDSDESRDFYDYVRRLFGSDETILVALVADDIFSAENLERLERIAQRVTDIEGVHHVVSLTNALNIRSENGDISIEPFVDRIPEAPEELEEIRRQALANPIYSGNIVSPDGRAVALMIYLMDMPEREFLKRAIDHQIERIAEEESGDITYWITGTAYVKAVMSRILLRDLIRTVPLAAALLMLVAFLAFRSILGGLIPLVTVGIATIWVAAIFAIRGEALTVVTVIVPPLTLVVGFAYAAHVVSEYYDVLREGGNPTTRETAGKALRHVVLPVLLTGATTAAGFMSLTVSPLSAIRQFGIYATVGVAASMVVALTFVPALLALLPASARVRRQRGPDALERGMRRLAAFDVRRRVAVLGAGGLIAAISLFGMSQIQVSTDVIRLFDPQSPVRQHFEAINENFEGSDALYVVLEADYRDAFKEPVNLHEVRRLQRWLEEQPMVGGTTSVADYLMLINRAFHDDDPEQLAIPRSKALTSQILLFGANDELDSFVDSRYQTVSILVRSKAIDSQDVTALVKLIEAKLTELPDRLKGRVTGNSVLINATADEIAVGQAESLSLAFLIIFGMLSLLFTSFRIGLLALIPNAMPVLVYFGALGLTGVTLNTTTGLVACMVLGIAVDDTIHFLARFNIEAKKHADEKRGITEALCTVGRPMTYTSVALCAGMLAITTSELRNQVEFGALAAFTLAVAWLVDMTFTPALAVRMRIVTLWDVLTLDLGEEPHLSIPLFRGLTKAQARIAALLTSLRSYPAGHTLIHSGEEGDEMYVVIHGSMVASVPGPKGTVQVGLERGAVVGEVALFHGKRTADVVTSTPVTLLRLTQANLDRLSRRYPRIGTQLYQNLSQVLADRLARATERAR